VPKLTASKGNTIHDMTRNEAKAFRASSSDFVDHSRCKPLRKRQESRKLTPLLVAGAVLLALTLTAHAQIRVTVERNTGTAATKEFKFKNVPPPAKEDAAAKATVTLLVGENDPLGGDLSVLTDGLLPTKADEPKSNFYLASGAGGGRVRMDFGEVIENGEMLAIVCRLAEIHRFSQRGEA